MASMIELLLLPATIVAVKTDSKANPESDGNDDDDNDKEAPPFELAGASGRIRRMFDLLVALRQVVSGLLGVLFGGLDDGLLLLHHGGQFLI